MATESCVTKKRKKETSKLSKFYHNVTSEFNGYFNANELVEYAIIDLQAANEDNYTQIIDVYDYVSVSDPKMVNADMDKAIEKVTRVATLHEKGDWVDDCYVMMGRAQYIKQDYETAVETFEYFQEDFNPANPYGRNFQRKKVSAKKSNKERKKERKAAKKAKEKERKELEKQRKKEREEREKARKERRKKSSRKSRSNRSRKTTPADTTSTIVPKQSPPKATPVNEPAPKPKTKIKEPKDKTAYNEGLVWLAKSYIRAGKYTSAEFLLNRLEKIPTLDKKLTKEMLVAQADLMIKSGRAYNALNYLDEAIESKASKRSEDGRYSFIAGQILMENGQYRDAVPYFKTAKKKSKDYKMKFMASLNEIKCEQLQGNSEGNYANRLERMLKETKYQEFKDEIYFALGEIEGSQGNIEKAKEYFSLSAANNKGNQSLKTEAYYQLASITFNLEQYVDAKAYYDSTMMVIEKGDPRRGEVKSYAESLTDIAKNIETITRLDSVIAMASKSKEELMDIARQRLEEEQKTGKLTDNDVGDKNLFIKKRRATTAKSDFWAYNNISKEVGKSQFLNTWGERPLVDNWRQSSKIEATAFEERKVEEEETAQDSMQISEEDYNRLMADVPKNALAKGKLEEQVREAMFNLGKQYRDKLEKYAKSAETLETLNTRFKNHEDILDAYYYLYLDYQDLNNTALVKKYQDLITTNYPDSKYGKLIKNPGFAATLEEERKKIDRYYDLTYKMFTEGKYDKVSERVAVANETFGKDNKLIAKFTLLDAMASGYSQGQKAYVKGLNQVITRFPNTPEELKAKEILRFLKGDKAAFDELDIKAVDEMFEMNDESRHYVAVILFDYSDEVLQPSKIAISDYNKQFHSKDRLQMGEMLLNKTENTQLVLIRSFPSKDKAMSYYDGVQKNKDRFIPEDVVNYEILPITQQNYRKMLQQRTHTNYRAYFKKNYLEEE